MRYEGRQDIELAVIAVMAARIQGGQGAAELSERSSLRGVVQDKKYMPNVIR